MYISILQNSNIPKKDLKAHPNVSLNKVIYVKQVRN